MKRLLNCLISGTHQRLLGAALWLGIFVAILGVLYVFGAHQVRDAMRADASENIVQLDKLRANVSAAFAMLEKEVTGEPCSVEFHRQLRRVAFEPDGLNEFIYAPHGLVRCSTSRDNFDGYVDLGRPDILGETRFGTALWIDRSLDAIGLKGLTATIVHAEPFAIVIPPQKVYDRHSGWVRQELVIVGPDGRRWHRSGEAGIFERASNAAAGEGAGDFRDIVCDKDGFHCVAAETTLSDVASAWSAPIAVGVALAAILAAWLASWARAALLRYWSLEQRFRRHLTPRSVVCAYQPIMDLRTGTISACEVLARWRDINGDIVSPDKFIPLVEKAHLTRKFTKMVADTAFRELSASVPQGLRLQVNFNVFPSDLDSAFLSEVFAQFRSAADRFDVVVEIVESDALSLDGAQREIELLSRAGIKTYIDDFGAGYSNIHNLASLPVHGVKLDRSFAMAPEGSMMAKMLVYALGMVKTAGRALVVEGLESRARLELLRETHQVDYVQGYLISRPLTIDRFAAFFAEHHAPSWSERRAA